jgi:aquaporin Z
MKKEIKKYISELIGTFGLVFCGTGSIVVNQEYSGIIGHSGVAIVWGLSVTIMIYCFGTTSGAHLNPSVTLSLWLSRIVASKEVIPYFLSQISGAFLASVLLKLLFPLNDYLGTCIPSGGIWTSFVFEFLMSFILMLTIYNVAVEKKNTPSLSGIIIGFVVLMEAMFGGPVSGASMNPARSLAPALVSGHTEHLWIYLTAPFLGATAAGAFYTFLKN